MFEIEITRSFSAAHQLKGYCGNCRNLHGHNYEVTAVVRSGKLNAVGIALDFRRFKEIVDGVLADYDHRNLSELPEFAEVNPSSEVLAMHLYQRLAKLIDDGAAKLHRVRVGESATSAVTYCED